MLPASADKLWQHGWFHPAFRSPNSEIKVMGPHRAVAQVLRRCDHRGVFSNTQPGSNALERVVLPLNNLLASIRSRDQVLVRHFTLAPPNGDEYRQSGFVIQLFFLARLSCGVKAV